MGETLSEARNPQVGAAYEARGLISPDLGSLVTEIGSASQAVVRELVPTLGNKRVAQQTYTTMLRGDAPTSVSLRAGKVPVVSADYYIEAYDGEKLNQDIKDFVEYNIFSGMSKPFLLVLQDLMRCYEDGFHVGEKVFELREWGGKSKGANRRKYTMLRKIAPRMASQIQEFVYDENGGPLLVKHNAIRPGGKVDLVEIPIDKCIVATHDQQGGNLEGLSILRTAYPHWYYKHHLYKVDAIQKERHGIGVPEAELMPGATESDAKAAMTVVQNLRTNERAFAIRNHLVRFGFLKVEGQLVDVLKSVDHHNAMIMLNVMVQFLLLGLMGGGGRATSSSHLDMFIKSLKYMGNLICEWFNLYVIPQLVVYNFDTDKFPKMKVRNIGEGRDLQMFASAWANLVAQRLITPDEETEAYVRQVFDFPKKIGKRPASADDPFAARATGVNTGGGANKGGVKTGAPDDNSGNSEKPANSGAE